jgi:hypothetical protein
LNWSRGEGVDEASIGIRAIPFVETRAVELIMLERDEEEGK